MPALVKNIGLGKKLRSIIGDSMGALVVEYTLEKALQDVKDRAQEPQTRFFDPVSLFMGEKFLPLKKSGLTYADFRSMSRNPIIGSIIQTRISQIAAFTQPQRNPYDLGFVIVSDDPVAQADTVKIDEITSFMYGNGFAGFGEASFEVFARKFMRDSLILDQACAEIVYRRNQLPAYTVVVDAATIRRTKESLNYALPASEVPWYVQQFDDKIVAEYMHKDMIFGVRNPQTDITKFGYGMSELELLVRTITTILNTEKLNASGLGSGGIQKGILVLKGNANRKDFDRFKADFRQAVRNAADFWRPPVVQVDKDSGLDWLEIDRSNRDMEYAQLFDFLVKQATAVYLMAPEEVNWSIGNAGSRVNFEAAQMPKITASQMKGLNPLMVFLATTLTRSVVERLDDRYRLEFRGLNKDQAADAELLTKEVKTFKTVNEARLERGMESLGPKGDVILDPGFSGTAKPFTPMGEVAVPVGGGDDEDLEEEVDIETDLEE